MASDLSLHRAVFEGNATQVEEILRNKKINVNYQDIHGNTPLMIAVMKGNKDFVEILIKNGAKTDVRNALNYCPFEEAVSYGDYEICKLVNKGYNVEVLDFIKSLFRKIQEMKWDFIMRFDIKTKEYFRNHVIYKKMNVKIYKKGLKVRISVKNGDIYDKIYIFDRDSIDIILDLSENSDTFMKVMIDKYPVCLIISNEVFEQFIKSNNNSEEELTALMHKDISSTKLEINKTEPKQPLFRRTSNKRIKNFDTVFYKSKNIEMITKKRTEHVIARQENQTIGQSLPAPEDRSAITWDQYIDSPKGKFPHLGRPVIETIESKTVSLEFGLTNDIQYDWRSLLDGPLILSAPNINFIQLIRQIVKELPKGFPVSFDIPTDRSVYSQFSLEKFQIKNDISDELFKFPEYNRFETRVSNLMHQ